MIVDIVNIEKCRELCKKNAIYTILTRLTYIAPLFD